ncbi:MAG: STAS domain-containing protein [Thermoanaerobaculia bacterium]
MKLRTRGDVAIIDYSGSLVVGVSEGVISSMVEKAIAAGHTNLLINLAGVDYVDSNGLGDLVQSYKIAQREGAKVKLLRPQERVRKSLRLTMLLPLFEVHEDEDQAVDSFLDETGKVSES